MRGSSIVLLRWRAVAAHTPRRRVEARRGWEPAHAHGGWREARCAVRRRGARVEPAAHAATHAWRRRAAHPWWGREAAAAVVVPALALAERRRGGEVAPRASAATATWAPAGVTCNRWGQRIGQAGIRGGLRSRRALKKKKTSRRAPRHHPQQRSHRRAHSYLCPRGGPQSCRPTGRNHPCPRSRCEPRQALQAEVAFEGRGDWVSGAEEGSAAR